MGPSLIPHARADSSQKPGTSRGPDERYTIESTVRGRRGGYYKRKKSETPSEQPPSTIAAGQSAASLARSDVSVPQTAASPVDDHGPHPPEVVDDDGHDFDDKTVPITEPRESAPASECE